MSNAIASLPNRVQVDHNVFFVRDKMLVQNLADHVGIGKGGLGAGVVVRLYAGGIYWGSGTGTVWDWLGNNTGP